MIITNTTDSNPKQSDRPAAGTNRPETNDPPPAYVSSSSGSAGPAQASGPAPASVHPDEQRRPLLANGHDYTTRSARSRFCNAFLVAVLIWFLMSLLVKSIVGLAHWTNRGGQWTGNFPVPTGIRTSDCATEETWWNVITKQDKSLPRGSWFTYTSRTHFDLPLSSETLFLLSRGATSGSASIRVSEGIPADVVRVQVTVKYRTWDVRDRGTQVCRIHRGDGSTGVGIFNRRPYNNNDFRYHTYYEIDAQIPPPAHIKSFETDLPNSSQAVGDLTRRVDLDSISLKSTNAPITVKSLSAKGVKLQTSNSPIQGIIAASESLELKTTNAPILADFTLQNNGSYASHLSLRTSNNKIESEIFLTSPKSKGGKYLIEAATTNGPLNLRFQDAPLESELRLLATTSNSPASVSLHPTYEGSFDLRSSSSFTPTLRKADVEDPSGKHRHRNIQTSISNGHASGGISWSAQDGPGRVTVSTSNSPLFLYL